MFKHLPQISESLEELESLLRDERNAQVRRRIHLLVLIRSEKVYSRGEAAEYLAVHRNTIGNWLKLYHLGGLAKLLEIQIGGAPPGQRTLAAPVITKLEARLDSQGFGSYTEAQQWLSQEFGLDVPYWAVHRIIRYCLGAKLKRARPTHVKKTKWRPQPTHTC